VFLNIFFAVFHLTTEKKRYKIKIVKSLVRSYNHTKKAEQDSLTSNLLFCSDALFTEGRDSKKAGERLPCFLGPDQIANQQRKFLRLSRATFYHRQKLPCSTEKILFKN